MPVENPITHTPAVSSSNVFDMRVDDIADAAMEEAEQSQREYERKRQEIFDKVRRNVRQHLDTIAPYSVADMELERSLSQPIRQETEDIPRGRNPMIVNAAGEQQKRGKSSATASPPPRKRINKKQQPLMAIEQGEPVQEGTRTRTRATVIKQKKNQLIIKHLQNCVYNL